MHREGQIAEPICTIAGRRYHIAKVLLWVQLKDMMMKLLESKEGLKMAYSIVLA